jgi:hypothetical protein
MSEILSSYFAGYEAAKRADDAYEAACVAHYGATNQRWRIHTDAAILSAQAAKFAADEKMHASWNAIPAQVMDRVSGK